MKKDLIIVLIFQASLLFALDLGKTYYAPDEPMSITFYKDHTVFDNTERNKDSLISETKDLKTCFYDFYGIKKLVVEDDSNINKIYFVLDCTIKKVDYIALLQPSSELYRNWDIQYSYSDLKKVNYIYLPTLWHVLVINASGYIQEKYKNGFLNYLPKDFGLFSIPWAISAKDKTKKITFICQTNKNDFESVENLIIVNGFVSVEKESLYFANARAKRIRISYNNIVFDYELEDSANFQVIPLPKKILPKKNIPITLEILDIYEGDKFQDVVISAILFPEIHFAK